VKQGYTLIEVLLTIALFALLFYLASASYLQIQKSTLLNDYTEEVVSVVRQMQSRASDGESKDDQQLKFGVAFSADSYLIFATATDFAQRESEFNFTKTIPSSLIFKNYQLPDNCFQENDCVIFSSIQGLPSGEGSIVLENQNSSQHNRIFINNQGGIKSN